MLGLVLSRILECLSPGRPKSTPLFLTPQAMGKKGKGKRGGRAGDTLGAMLRGHSISPGRDRMLPATAVMYPEEAFRAGEQHTRSCR